MRQLAVGIAALASAALATVAHGQYCAAGSASCSFSASDERISRVVLNALDHSSDPTSSPGGCYSDFTAFSTSLERGVTYPISIEYTNSFSGDQGVAWIDWDQNLDFGQSGETITLTRSVGLFTGNITVPVTATLGPTRMRLRVMYTGTPVSCGNNTFGEVQDFVVNITPATTGACCAGATCSTTTSGTCAGTFQGVGSTCSPVNPCGGACCTAGFCAVSSAVDCPSGGLFFAGGVCDPNPCVYCDAGANRCNNAIEQITRVTFGSIDNPSPANTTSGASNPPCYQDFTSISTDVFQGASYPFVMIDPFPSTASGGDQAKVWIDWNHNFSFSDSGETYTLTGSNGNATFGGTITVPAAAPLGPTRLRVRVTWNGTVPSCGQPSQNYGEVEDYTVNVLSSSTGACCAGNGTCTYTTSAGCAGVFQGVTTTCAPSNPCGGACCDSGGGCAVVASAASCSGTYLSHAVCQAGPCNGVCCDTTTGTCMLTPGGASGCACGTFWLGFASTCTPSACAQGACCLETTGACSLSTLVGCTANSAVFKGVGTSCTANPCAPVGACCDTFTGACTTATDVQNCGPGRTFQGAGTVCTPNPCTAGACCNTTSSACTTVSSGANCPSGSVFLGLGTSCSPTNSCAGACCTLTTGACALSTSSGCTAGTTVFRGLGTTCTPTNACAGACCNTTTGACTAITAATGCASGSTYQGNGTSCGATPCAGACCNSTTRACTMTLGAACPSGSVFTAGAACTPDSCAAGTCCNIVTGACTAKTAAGCTGTTVFNPATSCTTAPCAGACCNATDGTCSMTTASINCQGASTITATATSIFQGVGTVCTANLACPAGACCEPTGACTPRNSIDCASVGTYLGAGTTCPAGVTCYGEISSVVHNTRASAMGPIVLNPTDVLVGGGAGTDRYSIQPPAAPVGIYKHTLTRTSAYQNQGVQLIGRSQFDNHASSEGTMVFSVTSGTGFALHQIGWYSFGGSSPVDLQVTFPSGFLGTQNLSPYSLSLSTAPVTPIDAGSIPGGLVTFSTVGETKVDTDMWIFDSQFNPIPGWGSDDVANPLNHAVLQSEVRKDVLSPGVYYMAIGDYNLHTSEMTPLGDRYQSKPFYDYPGVVSAMNVSNSPYPLDLSFKIVDGAGVTHHYPATKQNSYDVIWVRMTITAPVTGACCRPDGVCVTASQSGCVNLLGGTYGGNNVACGACFQPFSGACCQGDGTCVLTNQFACTTYPGAYRGNFTTCAAAACESTLSTGPRSTAGGFGGSGAIFVDITAPADHGIRVTRFDYYGTQAYNNVTFYPVMDVYVRPSGSYVGFEFGDCAAMFQPNGWVFNTQVRTNPYPVGGSDTTMPVVLAQPVDVPAGQTVGFYLAARQSGISGRSSGQTTFFTPDLVLFSDRGRSITATSPNWSGALSTSQQSFDGRVYYTLIRSGVCCRGATCSTTVAQGACTVSSGTAGASFVASAATCNAGASVVTPCCYADYNKVSAITVQDIFDYLNDWFAGSILAKVGGDGASGTLTVQDIFDFLNAWFAGGC